MARTKAKSKNTTATSKMITLRVPHGLHRQIKDFTTLTGASRSALLCEGVQIAMQRHVEAAQHAVVIK